MKTATDIFLNLIKETEDVLIELRAQLADANDRNDVNGQVMQAMAITEANDQLEQYKKSLKFLLKAKGL